MSFLVLLHLSMLTLIHLNGSRSKLSNEIGTDSKYSRFYKTGACMNPASFYLQRAAISGRQISVSHAKVRPDCAKKTGLADKLPLKPGEELLGQESG